MMATAWLQLLYLQRDNTFTISHCLSFEGVSKMPEECSYCLITLIIKLYPKLTWAALLVWGFSISNLESTVGAQEQCFGRWEQELCDSITSLGKTSSGHVGLPGSFSCFWVQTVTWAAYKGWFKSNSWGVQEEGKWGFFIPCIAEEGGRAGWRDRENSGELSFNTELKFPEYNILINVFCWVPPMSSCTHLSTLLVYSFYTSTVPGGVIMVFQKLPKNFGKPKIWFAYFCIPDKPILIMAKLASS